MTRPSMLALAVLLVSCHREPPPDPAVLAAVHERAKAFEKTLAVVKTLPVSPPALTKVSLPADARFSLDTRYDDPAMTYLVIHTEDLAAPPKYWVDEAVKVRLNRSGILSGCSGALAESKDPKASLSDRTLKGCTAFKYAFVVRTTEYVAPSTALAPGQTPIAYTAGVQHFSSGRFSGEVTVYDLSGAAAAAVGGFRFHVESSDTPSMEGGSVGALDRDLKKNAQVGVEDAFLAVGHGKTAPAATTPTTPTATAAATAAPRSPKPSRKKR